MNSSSSVCNVELSGSDRTFAESPEVVIVSPTALGNADAGILNEVVDLTTSAAGEHAGDVVSRKRVVERNVLEEPRLHAAGAEESAKRRRSKTGNSVVGHSAEAGAAAKPEDGGAASSSSAYHYHDSGELPAQSAANADSCGESLGPDREAAPLVAGTTRNCEQGLASEHRSAPQELSQIEIAKEAPSGPPPRAVSDRVSAWIRKVSHDSRARKFGDHYERCGDLPSPYGPISVGRRLNDGLKVAVKVRSIAGPDEDESVATGVPYTAIREVALLAGLNHPNVQRLEDVFFERHAIYLVREWAGVHLQQVINRFHGGLDCDFTRKLLQQLLEGVEYCHSRGIIFRHLRPEALFVTSGSIHELQISGLGAARGFSVPMPTATHQSDCNLSCRAPEILLGAPDYGLPVDLWSVGCIFAEMVCGTPIFMGDTNSEIVTLFMIFRRLGTPTEDVWPGISYTPEFQVIFPQWKRKSWDEIKGIGAKLGREGTDFLDEFLRYDPRRRCSARQALQHRWFNSGLRSNAVTKKTPVSVLAILGKTPLLPPGMVGLVSEFLYAYPSPQRVSEYAPAVYSFARAAEKSTALPQDFVERQKEINGNMRQILVDWLVDVFRRYNLKEETLFLAVRLIDLFMSRTQIERWVLQLVGVAASSLATKYEEVQAPSVWQWAYLCDRAFTVEQVVRMELCMFSILQQEIRAPTAATFLRQNLVVNGGSQKHHSLAKYLAELSLLETGLQCQEPSRLAASVVLLSNQLVNRQPVWPASMVEHSGYTQTSLAACCDELRKALALCPWSPLQAVRLKYATNQYHAVVQETNHLAPWTVSFERSWMRTT